MSLASKLQEPGTFCLFQNRAARGSEDLWLGRTVCLPDHFQDGQCCRQIGSGETGTIAGLAFNKGDNMIGVQWYVRGDRNLYSRWDIEAPSLQNCTELVAIDVGVVLASGPKRRAPESRPLRSEKARQEEATKEKRRRYSIPAGDWAVALSHVI